ncbi:hypothetical protein JOD54_004216 [Actinokineospora baliensis]|uniref:hypothetical protein n=1 Tax=Actinokineospora baliensis TaxID=547056 RepID=UPI00195A574C|nr:hypothetical protein [Actinokineospora baliensis]MBM7774012.1 hypothetical protein [Actinokineospora baliensis]
MSEGVAEVEPGPTTITVVRRWLRWITAVAGVVLLGLFALAPYLGPGVSMALLTGACAVLSGGRSIWLRRFRSGRREAPSNIGAAVSLFALGAGLFSIPYLSDYRAEGRFAADEGLGFSVEGVGAAVMIALLVANGLAGLLAWWEVD